MNTVDDIIHARWVLPIAPDHCILEHHSVVIDQGRIIALLPQDLATQQYQAKTTHSLNDHVLMPGLINAHNHSAMVLFRGLADDLPLLDWLQHHIWPAEAKLVQANSIKAGCQLAIAEMLRGGTTCFNDMYFFPNETAEVTIKAGMRACIGHTIMNVATGWAQDEDDYINKAKKAYQHRPQHPLISWTIAPQSCYTNSDRSLRKAKALANEFNCRINIHLHETEQEIAMDQQKTGKRAIARLFDLGLLDEKLIAVHMVHVTENEMAVIKASGCHIAHCPESNLKLASGIAPVQHYLNQGINVALGTDGAASNNDLDMFGEMRTAAFAAKVKNQDSTALNAATVLEMATLNGAKALGLQHDIGSIEIGKSADLIAINLSHYFTQPIYNPMSHLVYCASRHQVSHVWIAGQLLLDQGELTQMDIAKIVADANQWAAKATKYRASANSVASTYDATQMSHY